MYRVYISASTQKENIGLSTYGTEQARMMQLADRVAYWLASQKGKFQVFRNFYNWTLSQTIADCNGLNCIMFVDNHSNAGSPEACGTEAYFHDGSTKGEKLAKAIYNQVAPISPGKDRGVMRDTVLYPSGLAVLKGTNCPATLVEHMFHTNLVEVNDFIAHSDRYAKAEAKGICDYFGIPWIEPETDVIKITVDNMFSKGWITDKQYWYEVLTKTKEVNIDWLNIVLQRASKG
jgi:N-acetylmuramoyl-L-alanine amidase